MSGGPLSFTHHIHPISNRIAELIPESSFSHLPFLLCPTLALQLPSCLSWKATLAASFPFPMFLENPFLPSGPLKM